MTTQTLPAHVSTAHQALCFAWLSYNGQLGTALQITRLSKQFPESQSAVLERMLAQRGIKLAVQVG